MTLFLPVIRLHSFHALVEEPADDSWWHRHAQWQWRFLQQNFTFWSLQVQSVATSVVVCRQFYVMLCTVVDNMETSYNSFGITVRRVIMPFVWRKSVLILTAVKRLCDHLGHKVFTNIQLEWHCIALLCWCAVKKLLTHSIWQCLGLWINSNFCCGFFTLWLYFFSSTFNMNGVL